MHFNNDAFLSITVNNSEFNLELEGSNVTLQSIEIAIFCITILRLSVLISFDKNLTVIFKLHST